MANMNYNLATNTNFKAEISNAPEFNYFIQSVSIPGMTMSGIDVPYKGNQGFMPSDRIDYDPLTFTYILSEDFENYLFLYKWMRDIQSIDHPNKHFRDITLHILNNNKLTNLKVVFYNCVPTSLSEIDLESAVTDTSPLTTTVTFRYQYFIMTRKNEN
jgi:hypothetical protein